MKSYAERGANAALEVTGEAAGGEMPAATAKITMKDYSYVTSPPGHGSSDEAP